MPLQRYHAYATVKFRRVSVLYALFGAKKNKRFALKKYEKIKHIRKQVLASLTLPFGRGLKPILELSEEHEPD